MKKIIISDIGGLGIIAWALLLPITDRSQKMRFCILLLILLYT